MNARDPKASVRRTPPEPARAAPAPAAVAPPGRAAARARAQARACLRAAAAFPLGLVLALDPSGAPLGLEPRGQDADSFPALLWVDAGCEKALEESLAASLGGRLIARGENPPAQGAWLVFNAPGRDTLHVDWDSSGVSAAHGEWAATRARELLVRPNCWNAPHAQRALEQALDASIERAGAGGLGYALADEPTWTPSGSPHDWCLCADCETAWSAWRRERGLDPAPALAALGTDDALAELAAAEAERPPAASIRWWLERRRFHRDTLDRLLRALAERARCQRPDAAVGVLGLAGETAFGHYSVARALRWADFVESYRTDDATPLAFGLRTPAQRVLATVFLDPTRPEHGAWQAFEHALRGGDMIAVWSSSAIERHTQTLSALLSALDTIRRARQAAPGALPLPSGVALLHDFDSLALSWLFDAALDGSTWPERRTSYHERHGSREAMLASWIRLFDESGFSPAALEFEELEPKALDRHKLLIANHLVWIDEAGLERLERYIEAGGKLLISGRFALFDGSARRRSSAEIERWCARFEGSVERAPPDVLDYPELCAAQHAGALRWRERARAWAAWAGLEPAPFAPLGAAAQWPWMVSQHLSFDAAGREERLLWALPAQTGGGPWNASNRRVRLGAVRGWRHEWIEPSVKQSDAAGEVELGPGQGLVLRLRPVDPGPAGPTR